MAKIDIVVLGPSVVATRPLKGEKGLARLEESLRGKRRRLRIYWWIFGILASMLILSSIDSDGGSWTDILSSLPPIMLWAMWLAYLSLRVRYLHPRWLAAQRRVVADLGRLKAADDGLEVASDAGLLDDVRQAQHRLRRRCTGLGIHQSEFLSELAHGSAAAEGVGAELASTADALAHASLRGHGEEELTQLKGQRRHAWICLEAYLASLVACECEAQLEAEFLERREALELLRRGQRLLAGEVITAAREDGEGGTMGQTPPRSLVILPFLDLSANGDQQYLCQGLAEALGEGLARIPGLRVVHHRGEAAERVLDPRDLGRRLAVETVLEGRVEPLGEELRIEVRLLRVSDGSSLGVEEQVGSIDDVFGVQDAIIQRVVRRLRLRSPSNPPTRSAHRGDAAAYRLYLKGRYFWARRTPGDLEESIVCFQQAIEIDPTYGRAHAGVADAYNMLGFYAVQAPDEAFPQAKDAALRALELDDSLAEAHCSLGFVRLVYDWDWQGAEACFERTFELHPTYATARHWYAEMLAFRGRHGEAIEQARVALDLDPLSLIFHTLMGWTNYYAGHYEEAVAALREGLELTPDFAPAEFWLALSLEQLGHYEAALHIHLRAVEHSGRSSMMLASLGRLHALMGDHEATDRILDELAARAEKHYLPSYFMAAIHMGRKDYPSAIEWLQRAYEERSNWMVFLAVDPVWRPLRRHREFVRLVAGVGLDAP